MLRIGKPNKAPEANVRLPQMASIPSADDLQFTLVRAQKNWRSTIELPWKLPEQDYVFILTVKCDLNSGEPSWMLYRNDDSGSHMLWSYVSSDIHLIRSLIRTESSAPGAGGLLTDEVCQVDPATSLAVLVGDAVMVNAEPPGEREHERPPAAGAAGGQGRQCEPAAEPGPCLKESSDSGLAGDLRKSQMPALLQSIAMGSMTGRLELVHGEKTGELFFEEGILRHASLPGALGDAAALEMITWRQGRFRFLEGERSLHQSVEKRLDTLLMEGIALVDQADFLTRAGIHDRARLVRKCPDISDDDFALTMLDRVPVDFHLLKSFYDRIDDRKTLADILQQQPLAPTQWTPVLYNLVSRNLVVAADAVAGQEAPLPPPVTLNVSMIEGVLKTLSRSETGVLGYPALIYFLDQETRRLRRGGHPFSLVVFDLCLMDRSQPSGLRPLPIQSAREIASRIKAAKRELDLLTHFETFDFALLLPHTDVDGAATFIRRLERIISGDPLNNTIHAQSVVSYFGIAGMPQDCEDPGVLLAAARQAKETAGRRQLPLMLFRDLFSLEEVHPPA